MRFSLHVICRFPPALPAIGHDVSFDQDSGNRHSGAVMIPGELPAVKD
jgi:hypothetical protein